MAALSPSSSSSYIPGTYCSTITGLDKVCGRQYRSAQADPMGEPRTAPSGYTMCLECSMAHEDDMGSQAAPQLAKFVEELCRPVCSDKVAPFCAHCHIQHLAAPAFYFVAPGASKTFIVPAPGLYLCELHAARVAGHQHAIVPIKPNSHTNRVCTTHPLIHCDHFCSSCMMLVCVNCWLEDHSSHRVVKSSTATDELINGPAGLPGLVPVDSEMKKVIRSLTDGKRLVENTHAAVEANATEKLALIENTKQDVIDQVCGHFSNLSDKVVELKTKKQAKLKQERDDMQRKLNEVSIRCAAIQAALDSGDPVCMSKTLQEALAVRAIVKTFTGPVVTDKVDVKFEPELTALYTHILAVGTVVMDV